MTGWAPAPKQPKAAARGSGTVSFQDLEKAMQESGSSPEGSPGGQAASEGETGEARLQAGLPTGAWE